MTKYIPRAQRQADNRTLVAGIAKHITEDIVLSGERFSPGELAEAIESTLAAQDACDALRLELGEAFKAAAAAERSVRALKASLKQHVVSRFGEASLAVADFGYSARKVAHRSVAEKLASVEKLAATLAGRDVAGSEKP